MDLSAPKELELGPADCLNHVFLALQLGADIDIMTCPMWTLASVPSVFPKAVHIPVSSLDREQHASLECPLKRVVSKIPYGYLYRQQAAYTTEEAAVCSHCTLGPHGEKSTVGLIGSPKGTLNLKCFSFVLFEENN